MVLSTAVVLMNYEDFQLNLPINISLLSQLVEHTPQKMFCFKWFPHVFPTLMRTSHDTYSVLVKLKMSLNLWLVGWIFSIVLHRRDVHGMEVFLSLRKTVDEDKIVLFFILQIGDSKLIMNQLIQAA